MTEPKPLTYNERKAAEATFRGYPTNADWTDYAQEVYARLSAVIAKRRTTALNPTASGTLRKSVGIPWCVLPISLYDY
jgi:hypothetical protein